MSLSSALTKMNHLPDHRKLLSELVAFFRSESEVRSGFISGSGVTGGMDLYSDLDLGFLCTNEEEKEKIWQKRLEWSVPAWFHRMDADHIKPDFIIYLFEPHIHVDICLYTPSNLPTQAGAPYAILFDDEKYLDKWIEDANRVDVPKVDWSNVVHEDERFWTWVHYSWGHTSRGEYYDDAVFFSYIRGVLENWQARLDGTPNFVSRRLEMKNKNPLIDKLCGCFPSPDKEGMKKALLLAIEIYNEQWKIINYLLAPKWTTTQNTKDKVTDLVKKI